MKIKFKLSLIVIAIMLAVVAGISVLLLNQASSISTELSIRGIRYLAREQAQYWKGREDGIIRALHTVGAAMEDFETVEPELRRNRFDSLLHGTLIGEPLLVSIYAVWRPNAVDGMDAEFIGREGSTPTGQYAIQYTQDGSIVTASTLPQADINTAIANMDGPTARIDMAFDPVPARVGGKDTYLIKIAIPVINPGNGQTVARVGCLFTIDAIQPSVEELIRNHGEEISAFSIYSQNGFIMGSYIAERVGRNLTEVDTIYGDYIQEASRAVAEGREFECKSYAPQLRTNVEIVTVPFQIGNSNKYWTVMIGAAESYILREVNAMTRFTIILAIIAIVVTAVIVFFTLSSTTKPIVTVAETLKDISEGEGDLTKSIKINSKDEIGDLALYFNNTLEKIKSLVVKIKEEAVVLSDVGDNLASNMNETAAATNEITANMTGIKDRVMSQSATVSETHATMEQVVANLNKLNGHIDNQTNSISQASSAIEEMVANIDSVTKTVISNTDNVKTMKDASQVGRTGLQDVAQDIQEIARESEGLMEINSVMENIASQTNLLSMNAAIEAAHAGEAGKGFAVVADEIRKLAENSSEQSKTIGTVLKKIKDSIDKITTSTDNVLKRFEAIDTSISTVSNQEDNIRAAMEEQGEGSRQVLEGVGGVNEITRRVKSDAGQMLEGAGEVIKESLDLEKITQEIAAGMNEMATGVEQIGKAINQVNDLSAKNRDVINSLIKEVGKFKVE